MGIKDLTAFLKDKCPECIVKTSLHELNKSKTHKRAAIDTSLFFYKYKYKMDELFINEFVEQINRLLINNITPIYVFDGIPPIEKKDTIESRKNKRNEYKEQLKILEDSLIDYKNSNLVQDYVHFFCGG